MTTCPDPERPWITPEMQRHKVLGLPGGGLAMTPA
jgi:hypothetical protein